MPTRLIIASDLHQCITKWRVLVRVVQQQKPRFVLIPGDLLPKEGGFPAQRKFFLLLADYLEAMRPFGETTISGHIHESPYQPGGRWLAQVGRTTWVRPGQLGEKLHYVSLEIGDNGDIGNPRHSLFGHPLPP